MKNTTDDGQGPLLLSAQGLKAYFENKMNSAPLSPERQDEVRRAIQDLIAAAGDLDGEKAAMAAFQARVAMTHEELPSNVIPLRRKTISRDTEASRVNDRKYILRLDCLIEAKYISEIHKMATELHSQSQRYAFLEFRDIDKQARQSLPDLLAMGALTIFIPSILDLTFGEQEVLSRLTDQETVNRPLLMVGSTVPYSDLRIQPGVNLDLLAKLSRAYIKLSKPFAEYKDQGLIHYFLDSLSQNP